VLHLKVLVSELFAVDGFTTGAVLPGEVAALAHEIWDDSVEGGAGVAEAFFAGAEGSEVFAGFGDYVGVEVEGDSAGGFAANFHVEVDFSHFWCGI